MSTLAGDVCLFVFLTGRSVRRHTWVLVGPDSNIGHGGGTTLLLRRMTLYGALFIYEEHYLLGSLFVPVRVILMLAISN